MRPAAAGVVRAVERRATGAGRPSGLDAAEVRGEPIGRLVTVRGVAPIALRTTSSRSAGNPLRISPGRRGRAPARYAGSDENIT